MSPNLNANVTSPPPLLIVISGTSASGKDTVVQHLQQRGLQFEFVVTVTTRPPRPDEVHGRNYWFVPDAEFARMIKNNEFIEHTVVYGENKGVPKANVRQALASGRDVVMRLDVQGAETIRQLVPEALLIFITTDGEQDMVNRLRERKTESADSLAVRVAAAREELKHVPSFDYVIVNHENRLEHTVDVVLAIIEAEHHRVRHRKVNL